MDKQVECEVLCNWSQDFAHTDKPILHKPQDKVTLDLTTARGLEAAKIVKILTKI